MTTLTTTWNQVAGVEVPCPECGGRRYFGTGLDLVPCRNCGGTGYVYLFPDETGVRINVCPRHDLDNEEFRCGWCHRHTEQGWDASQDLAVWLIAAQTVGLCVRIRSVKGRGAGMEFYGGYLNRQVYGWVERWCNNPTELTLDAIAAAVEQVEGRRWPDG